MKTTIKPKSKTNCTGGNLTPAETRPLIMAARAAWTRQHELGLLAPTDDFSTWRHAQVEAAIGKPGFSACVHADYRPLMAHFKILAGNDVGAFRDLIHTGKATDRSTPGDTHEDRRIIAHHIAEAIQAHQAHQADGGKIGIGYVVAIVRAKTRRPDLTLTGDLQAALADRCTVAQLDQIRSTIINRIAAAEGRGDSAGRNRSARLHPSGTATASPLQTPAATQ